MILDDFFPKWYLAQTILEEMAAARSRIMDFHAEMKPTGRRINVNTCPISA